MIAYFWNFIDLFTESAPWLLLGLLIAGLMKWLVPMALLQKHMGDNSFSSVIKAAFIGAPLPLCSCGVIPAAIGLKRAGASRSSTVSFLIATPETGVDSISVSYALLGPFFAIIRPFAAIFTAIYAGVMVKLFAISDQKQPLDAATIDEKAKSDNNSTSSSCCSTDKSVKVESAAKSCCSSDPKIETEQKSCCSSEKPAEASESKVSCCSTATESMPSNDDHKTESEKSCCSSEKPDNIEAKPTLSERLKQSLAFSSGKLLSDLTKWLLIGLLLAAAIKTWVSTDFLTQWGDGFVAMAVMAIIGIPMYICATASTPLAAGFLAAGLSPGAILVFMLAGPATNIATMGMIRQEMGTRVLTAYLFSLFTASIAIGYLANWLIHLFNFSIPIVAAGDHDMNQSIIYQLSALLLAALMIRNWLKR